jgi:hypothetical protein
MALVEYLLDIAHFLLHPAIQPLHGAFRLLGFVTS